MAERFQGIDQGAIQVGEGQGVERDSGESQHHEIPEPGKS